MIWLNLKRFLQENKVLLIMKNILVMGCGRSGTSLVMGCLSKAGYNIGDNSIIVRESNVYGFFEDSEINRINDEIIQKSYPKKLPFSGEWIFDEYDWVAGRWLAQLSLGAKIYSSKEIKRKISEKITKKPFCYKDTRFGYTFPTWKSLLKDTVFIVVLRDPSLTALSIVRECRNAKYLQNFNIDFKTALNVWRLVYSHILKHYMEDDNKKNWMFIHYDQLFSIKSLEKISKFTGAKIDYDFPDRSLKRLKFKRKINKETEEIYNKLCSLADYEAFSS
jgi:hypothetical protein